MAGSETCRSSARCELPATHGTFGHYFCAGHFEEVDLIRRTWFSADGTPLRAARDPDDAPLSVAGVADEMVEIVRAAHPRPVTRAEIRRALGLPHSTSNQAAVLASGRRQLVSTRAGYMLAGQTET